MPLGIGQILLAVAVVVVPRLLAARYPLLGWRIGWLALLLAPLAPEEWRGGWPWGPAQLLALLMVFCVAGVRQQRPVLWALILLPWWIWLAADVANLNGPVAATIVFTAGTIALDSISSRWRTQRALAAQTERAELEQAGRVELHRPFGWLHADHVVVFAVSTARDRRADPAHPAAQTGRRLARPGRE